MSVFGYVLSDDVVEDAVVATLKKWFGTCLAEVEEQRGQPRGFYQRPRSYEVHTDFDSFPEEALPRVVVVSLGWSDDPKKDGKSKFEYYYQIGVACIASSTDQVKSRRYAYRLGAAAQLALVQHQSLDQQIGGRVTGVVPVDRARNGEIPMDADRTLWVHRQQYRIAVKDALTMWAGPSAPLAPLDPGQTGPIATPLDPDTQPWPPLPEVGTPGFSVTPIDPTEVP